MHEKTDKKITKNDVFIENAYVYILVAVISAAVLLLCLIVNRCIPFGDRFPISGLGFTQHYCWFVDCMNQIKSGNGISILDYSQGLVKDNYETGAYTYLYMLLRPWLYIIYLIVPEDLYIEVFAMGYYLYFLLSGTIFIYFINHRKVSYATELSQIKQVLLGLMYTMSSYSTAYFIYQGFRYMVMVPIIFLGIEKLVYERKPILYIISLFYMMATDAYSSFILCIFIVMYFMVLEFDDIKSFFSKTISLAICSFCSAGLAAFSLIPFFIRTRYSPYESGDSLIPSLFNWLGNIFYTFSDISPAREGVITTPMEYRANIYCGLIVILTFPFFYFIKRINWITKLKMSVFLVVTYLAFDNSLLNFIFHGFHHQWQVPNRYAAFFIFIVLVIFADILGNLDDISEKKKLGCVLSSACILCISYIITGLNSAEMDSSITHFIPGFIFIGIYLIIAVINVFKTKTSIYKVIFSITIVELMISCFVSLRFSTNSEVNSDMLEYVKNISVFSEHRSDMKDPFVITERPGTNDNQNMACLTNTNSISYYSSTSYRQMTDLMNRWGLLFSTNLTYYTTGSPLADMMMHVRYHVVDKEDIYTKSPYEFIAQSGNLMLYRNSYSLPLGILLERNEKLDSWNDKSDKYDSYETPFDRENEFAHCFEVGDIYDRIQIKKIGSVEEALNPEDSYYMVTEDESGGASIAFLIGQSLGGSIYMQVSNSLQYIGTSNMGECDTLYFYVPRTLYSTLNEKLSFGVFNEENFSKLYTKLSDNTMVDQKFYSDSIKGKIYTEKSGLLYLAMPYLPGFVAYVDGTECNITSFMDGIGLNLDEGEHSIELRYIPKGLWIGILISGISLIGFIIYIVSLYFSIKEVDRKNIKKRIGLIYLVLALLPVTICINDLSFDAFNNGWFIVLSGLIISIINIKKIDIVKIEESQLKRVNVLSIVLSILLMIMLPLGDVIMNDFYIKGNLIFQFWKWIIFIPAIMYSSVISIRFILYQFIHYDAGNEIVNGKGKLSANCCFTLIAIESIIFLISTFPGYYLQDDVLRVLLRVYENSPSDWDTYGYYLFVKIFSINGKFIYGVNIIQTVIWIMINLYIVKNLEKWSRKGMTLYTIISMISVGPFLYLEIMYKDTVFSMGMLALAAGMFNVIRKRSIDRFDILILTVPSFFATLCRKGGAVATLSGVIILTLFLIKENRSKVKKMVFVSVSHLFVYLLIYSVLFNINNVKSVDPYVKYGTPLSIIGAAVKEDFELDPDDVEKLEEVMELSEWSRCYNRYWVDSIARLWGDIKTENLVQLNNLVSNNDYGSFILQLNAKILIKRPDIWMDSFFAMANQLWEISKPYDMPEYNARDTQLFYFEKDENITYTPFYYLTDFVTSFYNDTTILHTIFYRGGLSVFAMILSIVLLFLLKKRKYILIFIPLILYTVVLSLAIPAPDMRYILPLVETAGFTVAFMSDIKRVDDNE